MNQKLYGKFEDAINDVESQLINNGYDVHTEKWQGMNISDKPQAAMREIFNHSFSVPIYTENLEDLANDIKPNLPWADDHFQERVGGKPLNPGVQWANWPWAKSANQFRTEDEKFTHTYMERMWPKEAGDKHNVGIRYDLGDLSDVVNLLEKEPNTRQAYLPIWFPEDTGAVHGGRLPCSIGYHFFQRHDYLHIVYQLRSCDAVRHFRDDIYLTTRLNLHVLDELRDRDKKWEDIKPGFYTQHTTSMHCFQGDLYNLKQKQRDKLIPDSQKAMYDGSNKRI